MKTLLSLCLLAAFSGAALATDFATVAFATSNGAGGSPNVGQSFRQVGDSYFAEFTSFRVAGDSPIDVQWTHSFDGSVIKPNSPAREAFSSVTQIVRGRVSRSQGAGAVSFSAALSENVTDVNGAPVGTAGNTFNFTDSVTDGGEVAFEIRLAVPFNRPLQKGFAIKDDLVFNAGPLSIVRVESIEERFAPVPEPATMAVLGLGAALLRRRRKG